MSLIKPESCDKTDTVIGENPDDVCWVGSKSTTTVVTASIKYDRDSGEVNYFPETKKFDFDWMTSPTSTSPVYRSSNFCNIQILVFDAIYNTMYTVLHFTCLLYTEIALLCLLCMIKYFCIIM